MKSLGLKWDPPWAAEKAGCSLAASITAEDVRRLKQQFPGVPVVTYVNTYADVKAETDVCCTSGNAVAVVNSLDSDRVIFIPDEFLAKNVAQETGKQIIIPSAAEGQPVGGSPQESMSHDSKTGHPIIPLETEAFDLLTPGYHCLDRLAVTIGSRFGTKAASR